MPRYYIRGDKGRFAGSTGGSGGFVGGRRSRGKGAPGVPAGHVQIMRMGAGGKMVRARANEPGARAISRFVARREVVGAGLGSRSVRVVSTRTRSVGRLNATTVTGRVGGRRAIRTIRRTGEPPSGRATYVVAYGKGTYPGVGVRAARAGLRYTAASIAVRHLTG